MTFWQNSANSLKEIDFHSKQQLFLPWAILSEFFFLWICSDLPKVYTAMIIISAWLRTHILSQKWVNFIEKLNLRLWSCGGFCQSWKAWFYSIRIFEFTWKQHQENRQRLEGSNSGISGFWNNFDVDIESTKIYFEMNFTWMCLPVLTYSYKVVSKL